MVRSNDEEAGAVTQDDSTLEDGRNEEEEDSLSDNPEIPNNVALREQSKATIRMARRTGYFHCQSFRCIFYQVRGVIILRNDSF
jgi:hypothetical protein